MANQKMQYVYPKGTYKTHNHDESEFGVFRFFNAGGLWGVANHDVVKAIGAVRSTAALSFWKHREFKNAFKVEVTGGNQGADNCIVKDDLPVFISKYAKCDLVTATKVQLELLQVFEELEKEDIANKEIKEAKEMFLSVCDRHSIDPYAVLCIDR